MVRSVRPTLKPNMEMAILEQTPVIQQQESIQRDGERKNPAPVKCAQQ